MKRLFVLVFRVVLPPPVSILLSALNDTFDFAVTWRTLVCLLLVISKCLYPQQLLLFDLVSLQWPEVCWWLLYVDLSSRLNFQSLEIKQTKSLSYSCPCSLSPPLVSPCIHQTTWPYNEGVQCRKRRPSKRLGQCCWKQTQPGLQWQDQSQLTAEQR